MRTLIITVAFAALASMASAQNNEIGAGFGGSFYTGKDVTNAGQSVSAGFQSGFSGSLWVAQNLYQKIGGEIRYTYTRNDAELSGLGKNPTFASDGHAVGYDVLFYTKDKRHKIRPYGLVGAGVKVFRGTGAERSVQDLSQFAFLTKTNNTTVFVDFGVGIKWQLSEKLGFRLEVRDNVSPFPRDVIAANAGSKIGSGWTHNILPMFGFSYLF